MEDEKVWVFDGDLMIGSLVISSYRLDVKVLLIEELL